MAIKKNNTILFICFCIIFLICLLGSHFFSMKYYKYKDKRPVDQPNTLWTSKCGTIEFETDDGGTGVGTMTLKDGKKIDICFCTGRKTQIDIYELSQPILNNEVKGDLIEQWSGDFVSKNSFTATVKKSTYFDVGEEIVFEKRAKTTKTGDGSVS